MAQSRKERLARQRDQQRALRAVSKSRRKPTRDDIARTPLHFAITKNLSEERRERLEELQKHIVAALVLHGFDEREAEIVWDALVEKYQSGWSFQLKRHLSKDDDLDADAHA
ncbi:hypothetical protein JYP49_21995 [Nitratireductor aquimarinus]|uniref:hypothetical protein n=1 Tax=Nitratireductor TaxID=245876 RepID=UPI0019D376C1|nr:MULTISPECIES: hypothetical protein [Nitratireductor]MBN7778943.1 hypothetical protein [Nitratireductor pacificus]MBN7783263.1 hypothetical protein [Nitratireductor pacificus]MBN7792065.1 hypothetical protein [Nitratireductor aquimarinus]MBY6101331.1 hypothetical protein [Nitratireductor aquimarinus]MCA1263167.1 hypothetical protein [Nitratireductor aquimarinus]